MEFLYTKGGPQGRIVSYQQLLSFEEIRSAMRPNGLA